AIEERGERFLGEVTRPPDELDRNAFQVAEDALRRPTLRTPRVEALEPDAPGVREAGLEVERLRRHHEHLDVGDLVGHPARDAAGEHYLLGGGRERVRDALGKLPELGRAVRVTARSARCDSRPGRARSRG